jgi:hypothetical protein
MELVTEFDILCSSNLCTKSLSDKYDTNSIWDNSSGLNARGAYGLGPVEHCDHGFENRSRYGCVSAAFCTVLSCVGTGLVMCRSTVWGVLPKCPEEFIVSEVNSEQEQARASTPWNVQHQFENWNRRNPRKTTSEETCTLESQEITSIVWW